MIRADRRKFHYIYKITRIDTGKYYIGMHSTDNLEDGYFGSGKLITASVKKHGKDAHLKEILEHCDSRESLKVREKELIGELYHLDEDCLNLQPGGGGGFKDDDHKTAWVLAGQKASAYKIHNDQTHRAEVLSKYSSATKKRHQNGTLKGHWSVEAQKCSNRPLSLEKKKKTFAEIKHQQGENNSQFGTMWIFNHELSENRRIKKTDPIPEGWGKGRKLK